MSVFDDVIIFTHQYPYWLGPTAETYLEEEVRILAADADRVFVVAFEGFWDPNPPMRSGVPDNVVPVLLTEQQLACTESFLVRRAGQLRDVLSREFLADFSRLTSRARFREFFRFLRLSGRIAELARSALFEIAPDVGRGRTLLYSFWFNEPARSAILLADAIERRSGRRPVVISRAHGYDCYDFRSETGYLPCKGWMARRLERVLVCSDNGRQHLAARNPSVAETFEVGYLGTQWVDEKDVWLEAPCDGVVVTCSRMVPLKRLDRVARALALLRDRGHTFTWICIGDGETLPTVRALADELGLHERVRFAGALTQKEIYASYRARPASVFVNASETEGVPISIMEAMSFGTPVVATSVGGNPEIVLNDTCGKLVPRDFSDTELADAIEFFLTDDHSDYRRAARAAWEQRFSATRNAELLIDEFGKLCDVRTRG